MNRELPAGAETCLLRDVFRGDTEKLLRARDLVREGRLLWTLERPEDGYLRIRCQLCKTASPNPNDVHHRWCEVCQLFLEEVGTVMRRLL